MAFTTIANVAGLFPTFKRGVVNQQPPDALIQQFIDDFGDDLIGILERRFGEAIGTISTSTTNAWLASLGLPNQTWYPGYQMNLGAVVLDSNSPMGAQAIVTAGITGSNAPFFNPNVGGVTTDGTAIWVNIGQSRQLRVLEYGNRYGAASQIGRIMASFGVAAAANLAKEYKENDWVPFKMELNAENAKGEPKTYGKFDVLFDPEANIQTPRPMLEGIAGGDQPLGVTPDMEGVSAVFGKFGIDYGRHNREGVWWGGQVW